MAAPYSRRGADGRAGPVARFPAPPAVADHRGRGAPPGAGNGTLGYLSAGQVPGTGSEPVTLTAAHAASMVLYSVQWAP